MYGRFDAWPINSEFLGDDEAIFRVGVLHGLVFHCITLRKWLDILTVCK